MMDLSAWLIFLSAVFVGSYVQSVTGFAMGMIVIAVVGASQTIPLPILTAAASLITMVNIAMALRGHMGHLHKPLFFWLAVGLLPAISIGVWLLTVLSEDGRWLLQLLLGAFITLGSLSMMLRPRPLARVSSPLVCTLVGFSGGLIGGMFSASGPIMGWFNYRQPLPVLVIRSTLLCSFALTTTVRTLVVGVQGGLVAEVWWLSLLALPLVILGTWLGREAPPPVSDATLKQMAFALLLAMGVWILAGVAYSA
jgi:uncharacterized membrane protein YfcA